MHNQTLNIHGGLFLHNAEMKIKFEDERDTKETIEESEKNSKRPKDIITPIF